MTESTPGPWTIETARQRDELLVQCTDLIIANRGIAQQRDELRAACQEVVTAYKDIKVHATWLEAARNALANTELSNQKENHAT